MAQRQIRETKASTRRRSRSDKRRVVISGRDFDLDPRTVSRAVSRVLPEPLNEHYVVIGGRRYPPKQVIALVTDHLTRHFASGEWKD